MRRELTFTTDHRSDAHVVVLRGYLDENSVRVLREIGNAIKDPTVFDLGGIEGINSCGVAEWINFIERYCAKVDLRFIHCSPSVVQCINLAPNFLGKGRVESVLIPFRCRKDHQELRNHTVGRDEVTGEGLHATCSRCRGPSVPDVDVDDYFTFLSA